MKPNGVEKNLAKAVEWYRKSAEQGFARAQCNLGVWRCQYHVVFVPKYRRMQCIRISIFVK